MRRRFNNLVSVIWSACRIGIYKMIHGKNLQSGLIERISPDVVLEFNRGSKVHLGNKVRIHSGSKIKARTGSELWIGDNVKINYHCIFVCRKQIQIGEGTEFGPSVYIYDHDHDYRAGLEADQFKEAPVKIGKNCWIGANTVILRGTEIGDHSVVAAGSVVKGVFAENSLIYSENKIVSKKID